MCPGLPIQRGRHAEDGAERPRERLQTAIAGPLGDLGNRHRPIREKAGRAMQTQPAHGRRDRFAVHGLIDPMPVIRRQTRNPGETVDIERLVEVIVDMVEHVSEPCSVARAMADIVHGKDRKRIDENTIARGDLPNPADFSLLLPVNRRAYSAST